MLAQRKPFHQRRFVQRLAVLSGGFVAGQVIVLLASPILTRLFTPAEFGVYAVFTALNGIFANVLSLRYELAVPIARCDRDAAALTGLALGAVVVSCILALPVIWLAGPSLSRLTEMPLLAQALWLLPLVVAAHSAGETVSYWSVYRGTFRLNGVARVVQGASQSLLQVGLGLAGWHSWGLLAGFVAGCVARLGFLVRGLAAADRRLLARVRPARMLRLARRHRHYPAFSAPSSLLESATQLAPVLLLAALFGPAVAGWFGLGQRLMGLPVRLFAQAARQVFIGEAGQRNCRGLYRLFRRSSLMFFGLGVAGMVPIVATGPWLFALCFGETWRTTGEMIQLLAPLYLTRFVVTPVSQTLNVLGRQSLHLLSSSIDAALMIGVFSTAWWLGFEPLTTILLFSLASTSAYLLYFALAWRAAWRAAREEERSLASPPAPAATVALD